MGLLWKLYCIFVIKFPYWKPRTLRFQDLLGNSSWFQCIQGYNDDDICHDKTCISLTNSTHTDIFFTTNFWRLCQHHFAWEKFNSKRISFWRGFPIKPLWFKREFFCFPSTRIFQVFPWPQRNKEIKSPQMESWFNGQSYHPNEKLAVLHDFALQNIIKNRNSERFNFKEMSLWHV